MDEYGVQAQIRYEEEDNFDYEEELHHHQQQQRQQQQQDVGEEEEEEVELATDYGAETNDKQQAMDNHHRNRDASFGKLFVGGISWETTEEAFASYFSKYGEITDSVIMRDKHTGRPRGFGFVTFADLAVADKVLEEDHVIDGRTVEVKRTVPREDMDVKGVTRTKKIFVGGIPPSLTGEELKEYFSLYGSIVEHQIMLDRKTGRSRGFGFVTFETEDAVEKVFSEGKTHELAGKEVEIKKAIPKRAGGDYGSIAKPYAGFSRGAGEYGAGYGSGGRYGGKMGRGFGESGAYSGLGGYGGYGNYGGNYGSTAGFYGGYGGYGYAYGFGGPMYAGGGGGYGVSGYGTPSAYGGGKGYGRSGGAGVDGSYGGGNGVDGSYGGGRGYGNGGYGYGNGAATGRYHPYRK
ncbi:RRM_1 domain-containing protein/RRM_6 domain-containing protein, partial [Cephalotus follicularis]